MNRFIFLGAATLLVTGAASAGEPGSIYIGASAGSNDAALGCVNDTCHARKHQLSGKAYVGYTPGNVQFADPNLRNAFEVMGYWAGASDGGYPTAIGGGNKVRYRGIGVVDAMSYRIDAVTLTGRLGIGYTWARIDYGPGMEQKREELGVVAGAGIAYALDTRWALRADLDQVPATTIIQAKKPLNLLTSGVSYRF
jgi:hypothetical protein